MPADPPHLRPTDQALEDLITSLVGRIPADHDTIAARHHVRDHWFVAPAAKQMNRLPHNTARLWLMSLPSPITSCA